MRVDAHRIILSGLQRLIDDEKPGMSVVGTATSCEAALERANASNPDVIGLDVGAVSLNFHMPAMGGMAAMNDAVTLTTTSTPGVYNGKVNVSMVGEWQAQLAYEGPAGTGKATFSVTAR